MELEKLSRMDDIFTNTASSLMSCGDQICVIGLCSHCDHLASTSTKTKSVRVKL